MAGSDNETATKIFTKEHCNRNGPLKSRKVESTIYQDSRSKLQQKNLNNVDEYKKTKKSNAGRDTAYIGSRKGNPI